MISWIVASHDAAILYSNLAASMPDPGADEVIVVESPPSIAAAYNEGQARAVHRVHCYVHHDVEILDLPRLRAALLERTTAAVGMVGVIGSRTDVLPWWDGQQRGSIVDARIGTLNSGPGGVCAQLDGVLFATVHDVAWDETIPGFHGYDYDACRQMAARGLQNWCLDGGAQMVRHNATNSTDPDQLAGYHETLTRLREKWGDPVG